jgi:hypothetical protein
MKAKPVFGRQGVGQNLFESFGRAARGPQKKRVVPKSTTRFSMGAEGPVFSDRLRL